MNIILTILGYNIFPIFLIASVGFFVGRKFNLDVAYLSKLNFYTFIPAFMFVNLYTTDIEFSMIKIVIGTTLLMIFCNIFGFFMGKFMKFDKAKKNTMQNCLMFLNSGNIGVPLITLIFSNAPFLVNGEPIYLETALSVQIMFLMMQNIGVNSVGFYKGGSANASVSDSIRKILSLPTIYVIPLAFILKLIPFDFTLMPGWAALNYLKEGLVPIALIALGMQLAHTKISFRNFDVNITILFKFTIIPLLAIMLNRILGLDGIFAQVFLIASIVPTGVNAALIAVECDNNKDYATQMVVFTTILSIFIIPIYLILARFLYPLAL